MIEFKYNRGGYTRGTGSWRGDCVPRAIAIATQLPYQVVYDELAKRTTEWWNNSNSRATRQHKPERYKPHFGTYAQVYRPYLKELGRTWTPTMFVGQGCKVHLRKDELPSGRIIVKLSGHLAAVINGVVNDTYEDSREGTRCVYGYWKK